MVLLFLLLHCNSILDVDILSAVGQTPIYLPIKVTFLQYQLVTVVYMCKYTKCLLNVDIVWIFAGLLA